MGKINEGSDENIIGALLNKDLDVLQNDGFKIGTSALKEKAIKVIQRYDDKIFVLAEQKDQQGNTDIILIKFDLLDLTTPIWSHIYGTIYDDQPYDMAFSQDGDIIIVGKSNGIGGDGSVYRSFALEINNDNAEPLIVHAFETPNYSNAAMRILVNGNTYYLIGNRMTNGTSNAIFLCKLNNSLSVINGENFLFNSSQYPNINFGSARYEDGYKVSFTADLLPNRIDYVTWNSFTKSIERQFSKVANLCPTNYDIDTKDDFPKFGYDGLASLSEVACNATYPDNNQKGLFVKTTKSFGVINPSECYSQGALISNSLEINNSDSTSISDDSWNITPTSETIKSEPHDLINVTNNCVNAAAICHCGSEEIKIEFKPIVEMPNPDLCCYAVDFKTQANYSSSCHIRKVNIKDGMTDHIYSLSDNDLLAGTTYSISGTLCIPSFIDEYKTLTIEYLDEGNNVICTTMQKLQCKCYCVDTKTKDNIKINIVPQPETLDNCCYDVIIENNNDCSIRNGILKVMYPPNLEGSDIEFVPNEESGWLSGENENLHEITISVGTKQVIGHSSMKLGTICVERSNEPKTVTFYFQNSICGKRFDLDLGCTSKSCCETLDIIAEPNPSKDNGNECCYYFHVKPNPTIGCGGISYFKVVDAVGNTLYQSEHETQDINQPIVLRYCIQKSAFPAGVNDFNIKLLFFNGNDNEICAKDLVIHPCNGNIPSLCNPEINLGGWQEPPPEPKLLSFICPTSGRECIITYEYNYRYVNVGGTLRRDIQVISYSYNSDCACADEVIGYILDDIFSNPKYINDMRIGEQPYIMVGEDGCVDNFRIITSDCWTIDPMAMYTKFKSRCPDAICCYNTYSVCYHKYSFENGVEFNNATRLTSSIIPIECQNFQGNSCEPNNCYEWGPDDVNHKDNHDYKDVGPVGFVGKHGVNEYSSKRIISDECLINQNGSDSDFEISYLSKEKGRITTEFYDVLGNTAVKYEYEKKDELFKTNIEFALPSGAYLCVIKMGDRILCVKKVMIIR